MTKRDASRSRNATVSTARTASTIRLASAFAANINSTMSAIGVMRPPSL